MDNSTKRIFIPEPKIDEATSDWLELLKRSDPREYKRLCRKLKIRPSLPTLSNP